MSTRSFRLNLGKNFNEGARQVWLWMARTGNEQSDLLKSLASIADGASAQGLLAKWIYGDQVPTITWASRIEQVTGVPIALWSQKPVAPFVPPARAAAEAALRADDSGEAAVRPTGT